MQVVADENMPYAREAFGRFGEVRLCAGRAITPEIVRDADLLFVRSVTQVNRALLEGSRVRFVGTATIGFDQSVVDPLVNPFRVEMSGELLGRLAKFLLVTQ